MERIRRIEFESWLALACAAGMVAIGFSDSVGGIALRATLAVWLVWLGWLDTETFMQWCGI